MKNLLRRDMIQLSTRGSTSLNIPNAEHTRNWLATLQSKASSIESRAYGVQLASMINYFNKKSSINEIPQIDFNDWKQRIATEGLVEKVEKAYHILKDQKYEVGKIAESLATQQSQDLSDINRELAFHAAMWMNNYCDYHNFLFELEEYGDSDYLMHENYDFFYGLEADLEELTETHNYIPGSKNDVNLMGYYTAQFNWGKKVISYFRHPGDDFKSAQATKNILGR